MASDVKKRGPGPAVTGSKEARRLSVAILEVLAGVRTPQDAAGALGMSASRYYVLETRALQGLVEVLEPREKGRTASPEMRARRLEEDNARLTRECARYQALARAAQRSAGVALASAPKVAGKRRAKRPTVRALRAVDALKAEVEAEA